MSKEKRDIVDKWGELTETTKNSILGFLLTDNAQPKNFTDIWNYCNQKHICGSRNTLWVYLEKLTETKEIIKVPQASKMGRVLKKPRFSYALPNYENIMRGLVHDFRKYEFTKTEIRKAQEFVNKVIKALKKDTLSDNEVYILVNKTLLYFEYLQLRGFELLLRNKPISGIIAPSVIEDYFYIPYNLRIQLLWACHEHRKTATELAIHDLQVDKATQSNTNDYNEVLKKLAIKVDYKP